MRKTSPAWSFRGRSLQTIAKILPGPGSYSPNQSFQSSSPSFQIGKSNRLQSPKKIVYPGPADYIPEKPLVSTATTIFPKTKRPELSKSPETPGPGAYNPRSQEYSPGCKIPESSEIIKENQVPGPGQYSPKPQDIEFNYSIPKEKRKELYKPLEPIPGPGSYNLALEIGGPKYGVSKGLRYFNKKFSLPGPGTYTVKSDFEAPKYTMTGRQLNPIRDQSPGPGSYSPSTSFTSISYSIGKSQHQVLNKIKTRNPGPGTYNLHENTNPGYSIGSSKRPALYIIQDTPGPGKYDYLNKNNTPAYSISRGNNLSKSQEEPGPGQYNPQDTFLSGPKWKIGTEDKRLKFEEKNGPGPGTYKKKTTNESKTHSFGKSGLKAIVKNTGPGPGSYEVKSSIGELPNYFK
ncbi:hypothetical protein SteCoe_8230 [Stentor coeruleus]|uniref:Uncharacterized protein n=1 Tax=Stentor coeruleus TaxID=5963 RepID=A0A1R2CKP7_9CILI|nr:hypothetical protein SteCoe_8230 [Stentor coeruleus]